jgi:hypothetical protein
MGGGRGRNHAEAFLLFLKSIMYLYTCLFVQASTPSGGVKGSTHRSSTRFRWTKDWHTRRVNYLHYCWSNLPIKIQKAKKRREETLSKDDNRVAAGALCLCMEECGRNALHQCAQVLTVLRM